jgi:phage shock protein C
MSESTKERDEVRRLYRSRKNRQWLGVCGGFAEYYMTDPTPIRLLTAVITILTGIFPGIIAYLAAAIIMPLEPEDSR